jgi:hypothetical protein
MRPESVNEHTGSTVSADAPRNYCKSRLCSGLLHGLNAITVRPTHVADHVAGIFHGNARQDFFNVGFGPATAIWAPRTEVPGLNDIKKLRCHWLLILFCCPHCCSR